VTLHGLRPAELAVLTVKDGKGYVGSVKRNARSIGAKARPPRLVMPIDIPGSGGANTALGLQNETILAYFGHAC